jgi:hypothetical protein
VVDTAGDSVFGEFDSVVNAMRCALAIQHTQFAVNATLLPGDRIETRIGVHLGDVIVQDYHVYGDGVNIAARLESIADPGSICVSEAVYQQVHNKLDLAFEELGIQELKNIDLPIRLYRVVTPTHARPVSSPQEPKRARQTPSTTRSVPVLPPESWLAVLLRPGELIPPVVAACLLVSPLLLFPTGGAVLAGVTLGRVWSRHTGRRGYFLLALGAAIMLGAVFTRWSSITNSGFIIGGLVTAACGVSQLRSSRSRTTRIYTDNE